MQPSPRNIPAQPYAVPQPRRPAYSPDGYPAPQNPPAGYPYTSNGYPYSQGYPRPHPPQPAPPRRPAAKQPAPPRMSKAEALALAHRLKRGTVGVALAAFLTLAGLASAHAVGTASAAPGTSSSGTDNQQPSAQPSNPFFGNQPGDGSFGSSGSSGSQSPATGTGVS